LFLTFFDYYISFIAFVNTQSPKNKKIHEIRIAHALLATIYL